MDKYNIGEIVQIKSYEEIKAIPNCGEFLYGNICGKLCRIVEERINGRYKIVNIGNMAFYYYFFEEWLKCPSDFYKNKLKEFLYESKKA